MSADLERVLSTLGNMGVHHLLLSSISLMMMMLMGRVFRACCVRYYDSKKN
jgi:hypothetical protein